MERCTGVPVSQVFLVPDFEAGKGASATDIPVTCPASRLLLIVSGNGGAILSEYMVNPLDCNVDLVVQTDPFRGLNPSHCWILSFSGPLLHHGLPTIHASWSRL